jgi:WD40 repeat protein/tRNA A-37 threonylcarbamoyl transferase component Bud32
MLGKTLSGRYKIVKHLGGGGFGQTYLAEDLQLPGNPLCVVKQLKPQSTDPFTLQTARRLFDREAQTLYKLGNHDQIPRLLAHFEQEQEFYLVQEFIEGNDLKEELPFGKHLSEIQVIALCQEILKILEFVHQQGVIHRDIKPANIIRRKRDGKLVLIDFGAVKQVSAHAANSASHTTLTVAIGSPGYMPNEQLSGKPKFCSDIYAVGMLGIQSLTGIPPSQLPEDPKTSEIVWRDKLLQHTLDEQLPTNSGLADVLEKMVRYDYRQRYQTTTEALQALQQLCSSSTATVPISQVPATELPDTSDSTMPLPVPPQALSVESDSTLEPVVPTQASPSGQQPILNAAANLLASSLGSQTAELPVSKPQRKSPIIQISAGFATAIALTIGVYYYQASRISASERQWVQQFFLSKTLVGDSNYVNPIAIASDSKTLATGGEDGAIKLWDLQTGTLKNTLKKHLSAVYTLAISPDGRTLASGSADETIKIWNLRTGQPIRTLSGKSKGIRTVVISPDSQTLVSGDAVGTIEIWNLSNWERFNSFSGHKIWVTSLAISPDGQTLVSSSTDKTIKVWEVKTGALLHTLTNINSKPVTSVAISPNGQTIASGDAAGVIQLWDLHSGKATKTLASGWSGINSLAFRSKGQILASGSGDGIIQLWDLRAGELLRTLSGHSQAVNSLAVSRDGQMLVSSSQDKTIQIWRSR